MALVAGFAVSAAAALVLHVARPAVHASTSRVVTEASASHVTIADTSLDVSPESGIEVREEEHATVLTLERGEVSLHVAPREKDRPFLVEAGDVHVRVVGTEFTVRRVGVGAMVSVRRGVVEVREHGELATLKGGDHWPDDVRTGALAPLPSLAPPLDAPPAPPAPPVATGFAPSTALAQANASSSPNPLATPVAPPAITRSTLHARGRPASPPLSPSPAAPSPRPR